MRAVASIRLLGSDEGGLLDALQNPTRSLLIPVDSGSDPGVTHIGVQITATAPLTPGSTHECVELDFWDDDASAYLPSGHEFELWSGRTLGSGVLIVWIGD